MTADEEAAFEDGIAIRREVIRLEAEVAKLRSENASLRNDVAYWSKLARKGTKLEKL
jgi:hypothetical protein